MLNKEDKSVLNGIVDNLQGVLKVAKFHDSKTFHNDMVKSFKTTMVLHKAVQSSIKQGMGIDLLRQDLNKPFKKATKSIDKWCDKYGVELNNIKIAKEYTQIALRSIGTNEGFTFTILAR